MKGDEAFGKLAELDLPAGQEIDPPLSAAPALPGAAARRAAFSAT